MPIREYGADDQQELFQEIELIQQISQLPLLQSLKIKLSLHEHTDEIKEQETSGQSTTWPSLTELKVDVVRALFTTNMYRSIDSMLIHQFSRAVHLRSLSINSQFGVLSSFSTLSSFPLLSSFSLRCAFDPILLTSSSVLSSAVHLNQLELISTNDEMEDGPVDWKWGERIQHCKQLGTSNDENKQMLHVF